MKKNQHIGLSPPLQYTSKLQMWIEGIRPKTLIASISPVLIGNIYAYQQGIFSTLTAVIAVLFAVLIQIATNFVNDYYDYQKGGDTPLRIGPRRLMQSQLVSPDAMKKMISVLFTITTILSLYLTWVGGIVIGSLALLAMVLGYIYTAGPYSLSELGLGDICVCICFGPIATAGVVYLHTHSINYAALLTGLCPGLLSTAILGLNNLRDYTQDQKAGRRTIPIRFGCLTGKWECIGCIVTTLCITLIQHSILPVFPLILLGLPLCRKIQQAHNGSDYIPLFQHIGKLHVAYTITWSIGAMM